MPPAALGPNSTYVMALLPLHIIAYTTDSPRLIFWLHILCHVPRYSLHTIELGRERDCEPTDLRGLLAPRHVPRTIRVCGPPTFKPDVPYSPGRGPLRPTFSLLPHQ
jgi:hypothetical protein